MKISCRISGARSGARNKPLLFEGRALTPEFSGDRAEERLRRVAASRRFASFVAENKGRRPPVREPAEKKRHSKVFMFFHYNLSSVDYYPSF
jgi:hypothetical protein